MKIGIMTFHWATNYGAVLQGYALQQALKSMGHAPVFIDYYPKKHKKTVLNALKTKRVYLIPRKLREIQKEKRIQPFREKYLKCTEYYPTRKSLCDATLDLDAYICGSDQVWNSSFVRYSEKEKNFVYFLDFVPEGKKIASYAASFGTTKYPEDLVPELKRVLSRFDAISVREQSGAEIVKAAGVNGACLVPDPTLLLEGKDYMHLVGARPQEKYVYAYMLHGKEADAAPALNALCANGLACKSCNGESIEQWLSDICHAECVVTNSFHGTVFSILFQRPFVSVLIDGSGMNDRIETLLKKVGLEDRIYRGDNAVFAQPIDWDAVCAKLASYRNIGYTYLNDLLKTED